MAAFLEKRIGFYTGGAAFDGGTLARRALGGSETALIQAARALARRGHLVTVFNHCEHPGQYDGVAYLPAKVFPEYAIRPGFDVFIVSRHFSFFSIPFPAGLKVLWNHDVLDDPAGLRGVLDRIDLLFVLSRFHRDNYLTRLPEAAGRVFVTRNGVDLDLIDRSIRGVARDPSRLVYASRPERGLNILLETVWPALIARRPDLKLAICGYDADPAALAPGLPELYRRLDGLMDKTPGVVRAGSLAKTDYYRLLAGSALMAYPCSFPEISCIAAIEAQACRTPVAATDGFALSETLQSDAFKAPGRPGTEAYARAFVEKTLYFLDNPDAAAREAELARQAVEGRYTWDAIAAEWDRVFDLALLSRAGRMNRSAGEGAHARVV